MHSVTCARTDAEQQQQSLADNDKGAPLSANGNSSATAALNGAASSSTSSSSSGTASFLLPVGSLAAIKNLRALCASQQLLVIAGDKASHSYYNRFCLHTNCVYNILF
jgi:hypothetical protein